jgi:hypothetical protein
MNRIQIHLDVPRLGALSLLGAMLALHGCSGDPETSNTDEPVQATTNAAEDGTSTPISQLPVLDSTTITKHLVEPLAKPTALGETTAVHVRLPPPDNRALTDSLVRVVGDPSNLQLLFRSDVLAQLGVIPKSPGKDFFTSFSTLPSAELDRLQRDQQEIASGVFGQTTNQSVVFAGRSAAGTTIPAPFDLKQFQPGLPVALNLCRPRPVSTTQAWGHSLFITDPAVIQDTARTWDPCTGAGTKGGVWTFSHFMKEMSIGSSLSPSDFVKSWLSLWLNTYVVNGDVVAARTTMFNQVILPWATASGVTATLVTDGFGQKSVTLSGPLDLDIAPFRLVSIVNRVDLGGGGGGYASAAGLPKDAGELRFIFDVVQPSPWGAGTEASCGKKRFTTIFEYGVPGTGCAAAVAWAKQWTQLLSPPYLGFTPAYRAKLQTMTESVVLNGMAPLKGNKNAINQIRTNELPLGTSWELREFTLSTENPSAPVNGPLRTHTVARTPNDGVFSAAGADPAINSFVATVAATQVVLPVSNPNQCALKPTYDVPFLLGIQPFRGGNSLVPPTHWRANSVTLASTPDLICARHQVSLNTCNGCHQRESGNSLPGNLSFTHIDPLSSIPVTLSKFLTGGGPSLVFNVSDAQLGTPSWGFADLERRFQQLFDLSHCTACRQVLPMSPVFLDQISALGAVPADMSPDDRAPFRVGPITDVGVVGKLLDLRASFAGEPRDEAVNAIRPIEAFSH